MPVRGTSNYVWFTEQPLGSGATGNVYCGRHKRMGEVCAIKVFVEHSRAAAVQAKTRELELIKKLNHRNIVKLVAIEEETHTKESVLIMELCTEGSVYDMINRPENYFGFPELEFLVFMQDFASGLEYLKMNDIIHRDIKPGNILCSVGEDGRSVYKLTDFGSAREQTAESENFISIQGTEEYLHPDIYGSALMGAKFNKRGFNAATDLWSIGATLFHVASGQLPFQAYGGRHNKETMFRIISEKKPGYISGVQKERDGSIIWSKQLPKTCQLSVSLQELLVLIVSGTMEKDPKYQWKFEKFFDSCRHLVSLQRIHFYSGLALQPCLLYMPASSSLEDAKMQLKRITGISPADQLWFYDKADLLETLIASDRLKKLPANAEDKPIILWSRAERVKANQPSTDIFLEIPAFNVNTGSIESDVAWSREVSAQIIHYSQSLKNLLKAQLVLALVKETLCKISRSSFKTYSLMFSEAIDTFRSLQLSGQMLFGNESEEGANAASVEFPVPNEKIMIGKLTRLEKHIHSQFKEFQEDSLATPSQQITSCSLRRCESKFETYVNQAKTTFGQFKKDKDRTLSYNEEQIHKYDKIKLNEVLKKSSKLLDQHCLFHTVDQFRKLVDWHCHEFKGCSDQLAHIEKDLKKFTAVCTEVFASVEKVSVSSLAGARFGLSTELNSGMLCPTPTKLPVEVLKVHLDLIRISQDDNLRQQEEIERHMKENDEILNRIQGLFFGNDVT